MQGIKRDMPVEGSDKIDSSLNPSQYLPMVRHTASASEVDGHMDGWTGERKEGKRKEEKEEGNIGNHLPCRRWPSFFPSQLLCQ